MNSVIWGPLFWKTFDMVAAGGMTHTSNTAAIQFIRNFQYLLPCRYCRESMQRFVEVDTRSAGGVPGNSSPLRFVHDLHSKVNEKLGKEVPGVPWAVYAKRQQILGTQLSLYELNNLITILAANYDHNPEPAQESAWRYFWHFLPDYILDRGLRSRLRAVKLPVNQRLSSRVLRDTLRLSNSTWKKVEAMRGWTYDAGDDESDEN